MSNMLSDIIAPTMVVDYSDPDNLPFRHSDFFNINPRIVPEHFPIMRTGKMERQFRFLSMESVFTTQDALDDIEGRGRFCPDFAETVAFLHGHSELHPAVPLISFCGELHEQDGHQFIAYFQADANGWSLFFNWMHFKRRPGGRILVVEPF